MSVLGTGGAGYFGRHMVLALLDTVKLPAATMRFLRSDRMLGGALLPVSTLGRTEVLRRLATSSCTPGAVFVRVSFDARCCCPQSAPHPAGQMFRLTQKRLDTH